ncbi:MAG TPA: hypothetical protein VJH03_26075 [Blastocatellia bacterium]|nr:hypothetical protein [Blastocatellia bacterium]
MEEETKAALQGPSKGLFAALDGTVAHALIILGLALTLFAPLILNFKGAALAAAQAELDQIKSLKDLDMEEFKKRQDEERKKAPEVIKYKEAQEQYKVTTIDPLLPQEVKDSLAKEQADKDKELQDLKKAVDDKEKQREQDMTKFKEDLDSKYDTIEPRRDVLAAETSLAGTRSNLVIGWLGSLMLVLGLLVLTLQSEGVRQKVVLIVLLVVMFSALSGVNLDFVAQGRMGGSQRMADRVSQPSPAPK